MRLLDPWSASAQTGKAYRIIQSVELPVLVVFCSRPGLRRILLCTSGDAHTDRAAEFAARLAGCLNAEVNLFHVMQKPPELYADFIRMEKDAERIVESNTKLGKALRRQKDTLERAGVFGEIRLRYGLVVPELLKELQKGDYDLVVSGFARAEKRFYKYITGDLTREILNRTQLPVLVVRGGTGKIAGILKDLLRSMKRRSVG